MPAIKDPPSQNHIPQTIKDVQSVIDNINKTSQISKIQTFDLHQSNKKLLG